MRTLAVLLGAVLLIPAGVGASPDPSEPGMVPDAEASGEVPGFLGIHLQRVEGGLAEALNLEENSGVLIRQVVEGSPADQAGLHAGDIITEIDGEKTGTPGDLRRLVRTRKAGDEVRLRYLRDGDRDTATATLAEAERGPRVGDRPRWDSRRFGRALGKRDHAVRELRMQREHAYLGVSSQSIDGGLAEYFGAEDGGALVTDVVEDSPAAALGLKAGDVVVKLGDDEVADPSDLRRAVRSHETPEEVEVVWVRDKKQRRGKVRLEMREGPDGWFGDFELGDLDFDVRRHLRGLGRHFRGPDGGPHEKVDILRFDDGEMSEEMDKLREELDELRRRVEKLQDGE